ncbi:MAG: hypothetical protein ACAI25_00390 [Planctomycetota bacterium]
MRRLTFVLALALAGCAESDKKGDDATPPPSNNSASKAQPAAQPKPQPKPAEAKPVEPKPAEAKPAETSSSGDDAVVIKGSKRKDAGSSSSSSSSRQAKIDELNAKARESQGKDNGQPLKHEDTAAKPDPHKKKKDDVKAKIEDKDAQIAKLQEERKSLVEESIHREGRYKVRDEKSKDPERVKAIDSEVETLKKEKFELQKTLAGLEEESKDSPK